jgi:type II secretion system protein N
MKWTFNKRVFGYILFGIVVVAVFLYLRFPNRIVRDYLVSVAVVRNPDAVLVIGAVKPAFPPGVKLEKVSYGSSQNPEATVQINELTARLGLLKFFRGKTQLFLKGDVYGGSLKGYCDFADFLSLARPARWEIQLSDCSLDKFAYVRGSLNRAISGKLNATLTFRRNYERVGESGGSGDFTIANGSYPLMQNILGFDSIAFSKIEGRFNIKGDNLKIERLKLTGTQFNCSLQGDIAMNRDFELSPVTMNGAIELTGAGSRRVNIAIGGILGNPTIRLMP